MKDRVARQKNQQQDDRLDALEARVGGHDANLSDLTASVSTIADAVRAGTDTDRSLKGAIEALAGRTDPLFDAVRDLTLRVAKLETPEQPAPPEEPTPTTVPGTGRLLRQDLVRGTAQDSLDLWGGLNPCGHPEGFTAYPSGGDTAPLIDGTTNDSYIEMLCKSEWRGCNDAEHRTRLLVGNNPANGNATMDNTFAAYREGQGYATYFSCRTDPSPPSGWGGEISQIIEVMPPLASSHPPLFSLWEREDGSLFWSYRPTGGASGRVDTPIPNKRGSWRRFCLTQTVGYGGAGYHEFWQWLYVARKWERVYAHAGPTLVAGDPPSAEQLWGIYCESSIPGPRRLATANWQVCEWRKP